ncbi:MAG: beta-lactamase family protein [Candidatus Eremiobacteraeota bacterium]|nr:beta-lactamase family protein [Candidatus Eremiobacteraeota bacterium]
MNSHPIHAIMREACGREFTGAVARVEHRGRLVFERAYGETRADALARAVYCDTLFDLASLTKLFVATLALQAVAGGVLQLDEPLTSVIPEWRDTERAAVTLRMLLAHNSGMDSGADYRQILDENVERFALDAPSLAPPGERVIYSDLGFIALGIALRRATQTSLEGLARAAFPPPLQYRPPANVRLHTPATEDDGWRGRVQGVVHDEKAYLMGGASGHAGLFGTAADVARLTGCYLAASVRRPQRRSHRAASPLLPSALAREAVAEQAHDPVLRRGLGWALKTNDGNSCGRAMSASSFGHTGFVGTCVWADPERDLQGVLLTNAVYFGRNSAPEPSPTLRQRFYEAIVDGCHPEPAGGRHPDPVGGCHPEPVEG